MSKTHLIQGLSLQYGNCAPNYQTHAANRNKGIFSQNRKLQVFILSCLCLGIEQLWKLHAQS